jgi:AcrR family transcriptional regulator
MGGKKERIIEAARELIGKFGFKKTTMEDIAKASKIAKATIYHYFKSKEEIFKEIINKEGETLRFMLKKAIENIDDPIKKIRVYTKVRFEYLSKLAVYYSTLREEYLQYLPFIRKEREKYNKFEIDTLSGIFNEGVEKGIFRIPNTRLYAFLILQAMQGLEYPLATGEALKFEDRELTLEEALDVFLDIFIKGISK